MDRGAAILAKTTPEVTAVLVLALIRSVQELEDRVAVYESLVAKIGNRLTIAPSPTGADAIVLPA